MSFETTEVTTLALNSAEFYDEDVDGGPSLEAKYSSNPNQDDEPGDYDGVARVLPLDRIIMGCAPEKLKEAA